MPGGSEHRTRLVSVLIERALIAWQAFVKSAQGHEHASSHLQLRPVVPKKVNLAGDGVRVAI